MVQIIERTYAALDALRGRLIPLMEDEALLPGVGRRWHHHDLSDAQRAHQAAVDRADRESKVISLISGQPIIGHSPAPLRVAVLDARNDVERTIAVVEETVCEWLTLTPLERSGPAARITRLIGLLDRIAAHSELVDYVDGEARRLDRLTARALGEDEAIHRLDARCPHCSCRSLRAFPEREVVACINTACRCGDEICPCASPKSGRHIWPFEQWQELAGVLKDAA